MQHQDLKRINVKALLTDAETAKLAGTKLDEDSIKLMIDETCAIYDEDTGALIAVMLKDVLPRNQCQEAYENLRDAAVGSTNRGIAGGKKDEDGNTSTRHIKADGTVSKTHHAVKTVPSGIIGFFDRYQRIPYCRQTAYTMKNQDKFSKVIPFFERISHLFEGTIPERWLPQYIKCQETTKEFVIPGTVFTTVTVNLNWQTAVHTDVGDLKEGFGVMAVLKAGSYKGGHFVVPKYGIGFDHGTGDLFLCDVHQWHGNTPIIGKPGTYERLSFVLYYRELMYQCDTLDKELERAKDHALGGGLIDED